MAKSGKGTTFNSNMEDGSPVLGTIELNERFVLLEANSPVRAQRGTAMVAAALGDLVGSPLTEIQTVEQFEAGPASQTGRNRRSNSPGSPGKARTRSAGATLSRLAGRTHAHVGQCVAARSGAHPPGPRKPRRVAQAPGEPLASHHGPQRSHGRLRFHMDVARTERRTSPQLISHLAISHSFAVTGPSRGTSVEDSTRLLAANVVCRLVVAQL